MALIKEKTLRSGVVADYWRIIQIRIFRHKNVVEYYLSLFLSSSALYPVASPKKLSVQLSTEEMAGDVVAIGYQKIKDIAEANELSLNPMQAHFTELKGAVDA